MHVFACLCVGLFGHVCAYSCMCVLGLTMCQSMCVCVYVCMCLGVYVCGGSCVYAVVVLCVCL